MNYVKRFFVFWYDFLIGEDWIGSLIVIAAFGITYFVAHDHITAYWIILTAVLVSLLWNVWKHVHGETGKRPEMKR